MEASGPDLDGFPVLRIDQIPQIQTDMLERAHLEVLELIEKVRNESGTSQKSFVQYLHRQLNEMEKEVTKRAAENRVLALLHGAETSLHGDENRRLQRESTTTHPPVDMNTPAKRSHSSSKPDLSLDRRPAATLPHAPAGMLIPLPSQTTRQENPPLPRASPAKVTEDASIVSSRSDSTPRSPGPRTEASPVPVRRPRSGQPSRRSMKALEQNFGNEFVVGATERKRRFYPKKCLVETEEQVRARARESRRQIAMKRLLERKEKQLMDKEAQQMRRRLRRVKGGPREEQLDESSESESVSGGDDEQVATVVVPDRVRQNIKFEEESSLSEPPDPEQGDGQGGGHDEVDEKEESLIATGGAADEGSGVSVGRAEGAMSSCGVSRGGEELQADTLTETAHTKSIAALSKLRKLKEAKKACAATAGDVHSVDTTFPSEHSPIGDKPSEPSAVSVSEYRSPRLRQSESSPSTLLSRRESSQDKNSEGGHALDKQDPSPITFETKLREALEEISLSTSIDVSTRGDQPPPVAVSAPAGAASAELTVTLKSLRDMFSDGGLIQESPAGGGGGATVYLCSKGPDDLPGLKAWTLVSVSGTAPSDVKWEVNLQQLEHPKDAPSVVSQAAEGSRDSSVRSRLTLQRSNTRRICESLLTGEAVLAGDEQDRDAPLASTKRLTEESFRAAWRDRLSVFDNLVADASDSQEELFNDVVTCGNTHAVCKKLENLLRTSFTAGVYQSESRLVQTAPIVLPAEGEPLACDDRRTMSAPTPAALGSESAEVPMAGSLELAECGERRTEISQSISDDDDEPIDPSSSHFVVGRLHSASGKRDVSVTPRTEAVGNTTVSGSNVQLTAAVPDMKKSAAARRPSGGSSRVGIDTEISTPTEEKRRGRRETKLSAQETPQELSASDKPVVKITDVFKNIVEIFPAVQLLLRHMKTGCKPGDHDKVAVTLIECMTTQLKLYEEWMEVMDDYATVFSHDKNKGVPSQMTQDIDGANALVYSGGTKALHYRVKSSRPEVANIVTDVFNNLMDGWEELPQGLGLGTSWNVLWSWAKPRINIKHLIVFQKINHFHDSKQLTRKDLLKKNLGRLTAILGNKAAQHFEIMPKTFLLPNEYTSFVREYTMIEAMKNDPATPDPESIRNIWIMKPVGLSRGRGISLVQDITSLTYSQSSVLQKYVDKPLCLEGYKFDLRLYILVTSFQPLEAFIYSDGFARISTEKYRVDADSLSNQFIHLTNSSIQKNSVSGPTTDNPLMQGDVNESNGSKIGLQGPTGLWKRLKSQGIDPERVWNDICMLVVKSLVAVDDKIEFQPCCFELFGYDVLLDSDLRPWLIEVNASPSLARSNQLDVRVKNSLIRDIMLLIDPPPFDRMALTRVMRKRLKDIQQKTFSMGTGDSTLERDLRAILGDHIPRRYGEEPKLMGAFERLCPHTKMYDHCVKLKNKLVKSPN